MARWFHVTSPLNRASIQEHGLDWRRMGAARGIAGSAAPEVEGVFVCEADLVDFFVGFTGPTGTADVWAVGGIGDHELIDSPEGFRYVARAIPASDLSLHAQDVTPPLRPVETDSGAYGSTLTITFDQGDEVPDRS